MEDHRPAPPPREDLEALAMMLAALASLVGAARDLHSIDRDGLCLLLENLSRLAQRAARQV